MLRSLPSVLKEALGADAGADALNALGQHTSLLDLAAKLMQGRPVLMAFLKELGIKALGERQKIVNTLSKADRLGVLCPYLDEATALMSGLAQGTCVPHPQAKDGESWLANAAALKKLGNEAFKVSTACCDDRCLPRTILVHRMLPSAGREEQDVH